MVEMARVELASESTSTEVSPSAADGLKFLRIMRPNGRLMLWLVRESLMLPDGHIRFSCIIDAGYLTCR